MPNSKYSMLIIWVQLAYWIAEKSIEVLGLKSIIEWGIFLSLSLMNTLSVAS